MAPNYMDESAKVEGWDARPHQRRAGGPCEGPAMSDSYPPPSPEVASPIVERLMGVEAGIKAVEEVVGILERRLERVSRPSAPTTKGRPEERIERANSPVAEGLRKLELTLAAVYQRVHDILDNLEV